MNRKFAACIVAIQNEFCLEEAIVGLKNQGLEQALIVSPTKYWTTGEPQSGDDFDELSEIASKTESLIRSAKFDNPEPIYAEADYRNYGLKSLWEFGYDHVLFVDADEYWTPGALENLDQLIEQKDQSYQLPFVPTLGVPGLPVQAENSRGLVYVPKNTTIKWGRGTPEPYGWGTGKVLHFSATRKTVDEVVLKCRRSAHYHEKGYNFEKWFKDILPFARVGLRDVHMYESTPNVWPVLRSWTKEEWSIIPTRLHRWLAKPENT